MSHNTQYLAPAVPYPARPGIVNAESQGGSLRAYSFSQSRRIFFRRQFFADHDRAIGFAPVIALFPKRHEERVGRGVVLRQGVTGNTNPDGGLRNVQSQGAMNPVVPGAPAVSAPADLAALVEGAPAR